MGLAPVRPQRTLLQTTLNGRKAADSHTGLFPFAAATRGILVSFSPPLIDMLKLSGCSHLTWGRIRARPPGHGGNCRAGVLSEPGPRHDFEPRRAREGGATTVGPGALGAKCFSANLARGARTTTSRRPDDSHDRPRWGQQGTGGENTPGGRPGRCTLDLVASGATCAQRLDGSRDSAIHTKHRISPRSSSMRAKISAAESFRLPCSRSDRQGFFSLGTDRPSGCSWCSPPTVAGSLTLSPPGAGSLTLGGGDSTGAFATRRAAAAGHRGAARSLGSRCFRGIDNDPSAGSPTETLLRLLLPLNDKVQWTSRNAIGRRTANAAADPTLHRPFNRQIAPPTKNGHAPPPIESRKSSQSVNPYYVRPAPRHDPPVKARSDRRRRDEVDLCTPRGGPTTQPKTREPGIVIYCHYLPRRLGNFMLPLPSLDVVAAFRLLSESNPNSPPPANTMDQPGSILSRDRDANTPMRKGQHRARGIDGRKKVGRSDSLCESNQVHRTAAFTWVHEHCGVRALEHTRAETKPEGKVNADARLRLTRITHDTGSGRRRPNKAAGGPCSEGKTARRDDGSYGRKHHSRMSNVHHSHAAAGPHARCPARMAKQQRRHRRRTGKSRSGEGAPNGPAESVKDQKLELGKRVARATWAFPPRARRAEGHRPTEARGKWPLHCSHVEGQAIAQSAGGGNKPHLGAQRGDRPFLSTQGGQQAQAYPARVCGSQRAYRARHNPFPPI
ncbi:hypothetical protein H6P81_021407 [Aristolochia fimbriata]|uniref:Uncharacterized protein n=1 Tax=Aristolochia fimbriata TaxID=158543 RepID=A0AAV7DSJ8_ARIFI|nr:hypothetical protein H6P81_021407 [Aristolochia fimbriata]